MRLSGFRAGGRRQAECLSSPWTIYGEPTDPELIPPDELELGTHHDDLTITHAKDVPSVG